MQARITPRNFGLRVSSRQREERRVFIPAFWRRIVAFLSAEELRRHGDSA
jgi:hypothetical protein